MSVDPKIHGMNVYRSMLEDENAHLEDAVRTGIAAAVEVTQREADGGRLRAAIEAHKQRWTSVNSGDIKLNARPADLELWEVLDA